MDKKPRQTLLIVLVLCTPGINSQCSTNSGPHSLECLRSLWREIGCCPTGARSPDNINVDDLINLDTNSIQTIMQSSKSRQEECTGSNNECENTKPISVGKTARQSSDFLSEGYIAQHAANAENNCYSEKNPVATSLQSLTMRETTPYWRVDLLEFHLITGVRVIAMKRSAEYVGRYRVVAGTHSGSVFREDFVICAESENPDTLLYCVRDVIMRQLGIIRLGNQPRELGLCKVIVYGKRACGDGQYGEPTNGSVPQCRKCNCTGCHQITGLCQKECEGRKKWGVNCEHDCSPGCENGECTSLDGSCTCRDGHYGFQCDPKCSVNCSNICEKEAGLCDCKAGLHFPDCKRVCPEGRFGYNCSGTCLVGCVAGTCDSKTGHCQCKTGQWGNTCSEECAIGCQGGCDQMGGTCNCKVGHWGNNCIYNCGEGCINDQSCDKYSGECTCKLGFKPGSCTEKCDPDYYGQNCLKQCFPGCENVCSKTDGACQCRPGYWGQRCDQECGHGCAGDGLCRQTDGECTCIPGYVPIQCNRQCDRGYFGQDCRKKCSTGCEGGCTSANGSCQCRVGFWGDRCESECGQGCRDSSCRQTDGVCSCNPGFMPARCNRRCDTGFYGNDCQSSCGEGCINGSCDVSNGSCDCRHGYKGELCIDKCEQGMFGEGCTGTCRCKEGPADCAHTNGGCSSGQCQDGWAGDTCQERVDRPSTPVLVIAPVVTVLLIVLVVGIIIAIIFYRRKRAEKEPNSKPLELEEVQLEQPLPEQPVQNQEPSVVHDNGLAIYENTKIRTQDLPDYIKRMHSTGDAFSAEYKKFKDGITSPCILGSTLEGRKKNRFKNVIAYDHSRVYLSKIQDDPISDYINANYIRGYQEDMIFIAAQGPVKTSVSDFVRMLWEKNVPLIVMVTKLKENGKVKCEKYWPEPDRKQGSIWDGIKVFNLKEERRAHYVQRDLQLEKSGERRHVTQLQYVSWPDHGVPASPAAFLDFHKTAKSLYNMNRGPTVVHCSAGVGRTGTFLAMDILIDQEEAEGCLDIRGCVEKMRKDRPNMAQSLDQYIFIHEALLEVLICGATMYTASDFDSTFLCLTGEKLNKQFEMLEKMKKVHTDDEFAEGRKPENVAKNRYPNILPPEGKRPKLWMLTEEHGDYINAVFVHGYQKKFGYIITQHPLPHTVLDFWRLIHDYNCSTIVALSEPGQQDMAKYWAEQDMELKPFSVTKKDEFTDTFVVRNFQYTCQGNTFKIRQFSLPTWTGDVALPEPIELLQLYESVKTWQRQSDDSRILVHCQSGTEKSGLFLALSYVCEQISTEQEVDVFHSVKLIQQSRPQLINNIEQYKWLHRAARDYIGSFSMYANFQ